MPLYIKTEQFRAPAETMGPHLAAHRRWVRQQQQQGRTLVSGYLVDGQGQPGGGGLLILEAESHGAALAFIQQDPMILSGFVVWQLQGWVPAVGALCLLLKDKPRHQSDHHQAIEEGHQTTKGGDNPQPHLDLEQQTQQQHDSEL